MKSKSQQKPKDYNAILGLLRLFVVASIAYTSTVIVKGTDGVTPLVLTAPQVIWAIAILVKQFSK